MNVNNVALWLVTTAESKTLSKDEGDRTKER